MMDWFLPLIGGLGIGSLLKGLIDHFLAVKTRYNDRVYQEKRDAYLGLLQAIREAAVKPSKEAGTAYGLWQARCTLFGAEDVVAAAQQFVDTNEDRGMRGGARDLAYQELIKAMRKDLSSKPAH